MSIRLFEGMIHLKRKFLLIQRINLEESHLLAKETESKGLHQLAVLSYGGNQCAGVEFRVFRNGGFRLLSD